MTWRERFLVAFVLTMKRLSQAVAMFGVILVIGSAVFADEKATSLTDAQAAVEANLKTPEGKAYDERLGKEFLEKHLSTIKQCKQTAGNDLELLDPDGTRQRRSREGNLVASHDQDGYLCAGNTA